MYREIIGQLLGIIATALTFISYQAKSKRPLLIIQTAGTAFIATSFFFLDAASGFALNIVCIIRNIVFYFQGEKSRLRFVSVPILCATIGALGALSWQGPISLLIIIALTANTFFLSLGKPQALRMSILVTSSMMIAYNIYVFSVGGITNEAVSIVSSIIGIIRFHKTK